MTAARTARRKDVCLARRSSAGDSPARLLAPHPWLTASAKQRLDTLFAPPASPIALPTAPSAHLSLPDPRSLRRRPRPNPHRARGASGAPLTAISCPGASRTPPVGVRGGVRHAGVRETCTEAAVSRCSLPRQPSSTQLLHERLEHHVGRKLRKAGARNVCQQSFNRRG